MCTTTVPDTMTARGRLAAALNNLSAAVDDIARISDRVADPTLQALTTAKAKLMEVYGAADWDGWRDGDRRFGVAVDERLPAVEVAAGDLYRYAFDAAERIRVWHLAGLVSRIDDTVTAVDALFDAVSTRGS